MDNYVSILPSLGVDAPTALALALTVGAVVRLAKSQVELRAKLWPWVALAIGLAAGLVTVGLDAAGALTGLMAGAIAIAGNESGKSLAPKLVGKAKGGDK